MGIFGTSKMKLFCGSEKIRKAYLGTEKIYSAGSIVTYYVDSNTYYQEEVDSDASCLNPTTFTPSKSGWEFVGWREDTVASGDVLSNKIMGDEPITLYAVFRQTVTVSYYQVSNSTKQQSTGNKYYNNGNYLDPSFTIDPNGYGSEWTFRGWTTGTAANASVTYADIINRKFSSDVTLYVLLQRPVTLSYNGNGASSGSVGSETKYVYLNSYGTNTILNPSFKLASNGYSRTNASFLDWASGSVGGTRYAVGATVTLSSNTTFYAKWSVSVQISASVGRTELVAHPNTGTQTKTAITLSTKYGGVINGTVTYTATGGEWIGGGFPATGTMTISSNPSGLNAKATGGWNGIYTPEISASANISNVTSISIIWTQPADSGSEDDELFDWGFRYSSQTLTATEVYVA